MPRGRKAKLSSYVSDAETGKLERVVIIDTQNAASVRQVRQVRPPRRTTKSRATKSRATKSRTAKSNTTKSNTVMSKSNRSNTPKQSGKKRKRDEVDSRNSEAVRDPQRSNVWKNFFFDRRESSHLRRMIQRYKGDSFQGPAKKFKKAKGSRTMADRSIISRKKTYLDMVRQRSNCRLTRSMVKQMVEDGIQVEAEVEDGIQVEDEVEDLDEFNTVASKEDRMLGWVSATRTKHFLMGDTCIDWLSRYYAKYGLSDASLTVDERAEYEKYLKDSSHLELLFDGGNRFEDEVYVELRALYEEEFALVFDQNDYLVFRDERDMDGFIRDKYNETIDLMNKGVPVIAQGVMINDSNMTYGVADLLVRSDYLSEMFVHFPGDDSIEHGAPNLGAANYHYRVIDCKWTTMTLCVKNPDVLRNEGFFPAYKGQMAVYNGCLKQMQGYVPERAYVMAKAWKVGVEKIPEGEEHEYRGFSAFDRPGVIDYAGWDNSYVERTKEAIQWVQRVMTEGRNWRYGQDQPSVPELYPNMSKTYDTTFAGVKSEIADRYGEITQGWYVGVDNRNRAFSQGVRNIRDPRMSLDILGITSKKRGPVIQQIIDINKDGQHQDMLRPPIIRTNNTNWQRPHVMDYFVDFETITYNLFVKPEYIDIDNSYFDSGVTFMIGIGFVNEPGADTGKILEALELNSDRCGVYSRVDDQNYGGYGNWEFVCFYLTKFKVENELELFRLFFQFMIVRNCIIKDIYDIDDDCRDADARVFHWTGAELTFMKNAVRRMKSDQYDPVLADIFHLRSDEEIRDVKRDVKDLIRCFEDTVIWVDLFEEMVREPVVVRGCYRFKLKHFANAMQKHGLILTNWGSTKMSDGLRAMFEGILIYRDYDDRNLEVTHSNNADFKEIVDYNEVDCRVMWEIIEYLRSNHTVQSV
jgi:hypothetical protein